MTRVLIAFRDVTIGRAVDAMARYARERRSESTELLASRIRSFCATLERAARDQDGRIARLLDSHDFRSALRDMRARTDHMAESLDLGSVSPQRVEAFVDTATELGVGGLRASQSAADAADAVSRAVDHLEGFLLAHRAIPPHPASASEIVSLGMRLPRHEIRVGELRSWLEPRGHRPTSHRAESSEGAVEGRTLFA